MHTANPAGVIGYVNGRPIPVISGGSDQGGAGSTGDDGRAKTDGGDAGSGGDGGGSKEFRAPASQEDLDRIIEARLARERSRFKDYDDLKSKASEFDKLQESQKTELQKATDKATSEATRATQAELRAMRLEVALDKGLNPTLAQRLQGATKEELEADAEVLLTVVSKDDGSGTSKPPGRPQERLRGGGDPTDEPEETDPRKLAAMVPRSPF